MSSPTVIITGASSGIGEAAVRSFYAAGYRVCAAGRDEDRLNKATAGLSGCMVWTGDLCQRNAANELVACAAREFGQLDALVNSAGIIYRGTAEQTTDNQWDETLAINTTAVFRASRAAVPLLRETKGAIINIASDWGIAGGEAAVAYCASKGAVVQLTRAMALDHAREGIRINAICPGDVDTPMIDMEIAERGLDPVQARQQYNADSPTGRMTLPGEVASLALYLASDAARQINGAALSIDGGTTA